MDDDVKRRKQHIWHEFEEIRPQILGCIVIKEHLGIRNSDIYGSDSVIFLEGESENVALTIILPALGYRQIGKGIRLLNFKGKDNLAKRRQFLYYLKSHDTRSFIVADADEGLRNAFEGYIREGLLRKDHYRMWDADFEDLFDNDLIITATI